MLQMDSREIIAQETIEHATNDYSEMVYNGQDDQNFGPKPALCLASPLRTVVNTVATALDPTKMIISPNPFCPYISDQVPLDVWDIAMF